MPNWYVDPDQSDDSGTGESWATAKKHLNAMIQALTYPLAGENVIYLKVGATNPYEEDDNSINLSNILCAGPSGKLIIQPETYLDGNYQQGLDPFDDTDPAPIDASTQVYPLSLNLSFICINAFNVELRGLEIAAADNGCGLLVRGPGNVKAAYCRLIDCANTGVNVDQGANFDFENGCIRDSGGGLMAANKGIVQLQGDNYLLDCAMVGIAAVLDGLVLVTPWEDHGDFGLLEIRTTKPVTETTAILAMQRGTVSICTGEDLSAIHGAALVKVIDETEQAGTEKHRGVMLGSKGMVTGKKNIVFRESGVNDGEDTVAPAQQFMQMPGEDTLLVD